MNTQDIALTVAIVGLVAHIVHLLAHRFGWVKVESVSQEIEDKTEGK